MKHMDWRHSLNPIQTIPCAGRSRTKAEEIDTVIGEYIHLSALLCTDTATNYKKFAKIKELKHETVNERQKQCVKK